jgi:ABC-type Fe2+-enterobactin transport system substrate-binding protein
VPKSPHIMLLPFSNPPPHRNIAIFWRKSSVRGGFLHDLGQQIAKLPKSLFEM